MKNNFKILGLTAFIAVIALSMAGCGVIKKVNETKKALKELEALAKSVEAIRSESGETSGSKSGSVVEELEALDKSADSVMDMVQKNLYGSKDWTLVNFSGVFVKRGIDILAFGGGKFVIGNIEGEMAYSTDSIKWTAVKDCKLDSIEAIAYGNNKFVAGGGGQMAYSTDAITWTAVADSPFDDDSSINVIAFWGGKFVAVVYNKLAYSTDGIKWTAVKVSIPDSIAFGNNKFVAVGGGEIAYSTDGIKWTAFEDSNFGYSRAIAFGGGKFVNASGDEMAYSTDGIKWTAVKDFPLYIDNNLSGITYGNNKFIAWGHDDSSFKMASSKDGVKWTGMEYALGRNGMVIDIAYGKDKFVAVGMMGQIAYSTGL